MPYSKLYGAFGDVVRRLRFRAFRAAHELYIARLRLEAWFASLGHAPRPIRIVATACWQFPIYSQTFVHQEAVGLARAGFSVRFFYGKLGPRSELSHSCSDLWPLKRQLLVQEALGALDFADFRRRMPDKVETLTARIADAAGWSRENVERHEHFLQAFSFARAVEAWGADYLHSYFFYERTLFALVASHLLDLPRGVSCYADHLLHDSPLKVVRLHLQTCEVVVATSRRILAELETVHGGPLGAAIVKPNAIDTASFRVKPHRGRSVGEPVTLLCASRIDPKKGLEHLIGAVRLLRDRGLLVEAHIVGAPDSHAPQSVAYASALRAQVAELGLDSAVRFHGQRNSLEIRKHLEDAHIFVAPFVDLPNGDKDGIPTAVLEAMATGCAIVATTAGSIAEVVDNGREGLLVPQRNSEALAAAVERLVGDDALVARLGERAASRARREFDVAVCEGAFHDRVRTAAARRRRAHPASGVVA
jgi:colanic acid/amylovoran biosynthesis glycosyltransferase